MMLPSVENVAKSTARVAAAEVVGIYDDGNEVCPHWGAATRRVALMVTPLAQAIFSMGRIFVVEAWVVVTVEENRCNVAVKAPCIALPFKEPKSVATLSSMRKRWFIVRFAVEPATQAYQAERLQGWLLAAAIAVLVSNRRAVPLAAVEVPLSCQSM